MQIHSGPDYRPDIDGLRAIAVALVVLHHAGVGFTKGGFIGVDVFFVISGFLITRILLREMEAGTFSLLNFYRRRARRLFPALFAMFAATAAASYMLLFPVELAYLGTSLLYATFFVANILFFQGQGYFAGTGDIIPLLHTWSLSVEEQFYIVFPLILLWATRRGRRTAAGMMLALAALSFALSIYLVRLDRSAAFFLFPPRAWELLLGSLLATSLVPAIPARWREAAMLGALAVILVAAGAFNRNTVFPGWAALAPCLGAAVLIHAGAGAPTIATRLLSARPVVHLGRISYSLYLWHWPIMVLYRAHTGFELSNVEKIVLIAASVAIAHLSWRFIEQPFRTGGLRAANIFGWSAGAAAASCACAGVYVLTSGLAERYPEAVRRFAAFDYQQGPAYREGACFISRAFSHDPRLDEKCLTLDPARRNYLIIGDSHAAHYWAGFQQVFPEINFLQATASGCKPTIRGAGARRCRAVMDRTFNAFIPSARLDAVILSARWTQDDLPHVLRTIEALRAHAPKVIVMGPIMTYDDYLPRLLARAEVSRDADMVRRARNHQPRAVDQAFKDALASGQARYVSVIDLLCGPNYNCRTLDASGLPLQFDRAHLTANGAAEVASRIRAHGGWFDPAAPVARAASR